MENLDIICCFIIDNILNLLQHLTCTETRDSSFGENVSQTVLPITVPVTQDDASSLNAEMPLSQPLPFCAEEFQLVDQSGHSLYEVQSLEGSNTHMVSTYRLKCWMHFAFGEQGLCHG